MRIVKAGYEILTQIDRSAFLKSIELAGRTCYKSEDKITEESAPKFVRMLIKRGHEAMIEHAPSISVKFICDRGVSHEIVRHRLFSFAQESTRYCNYGKEDSIIVIEPCFWLHVPNSPKVSWMNYMWVELMLKAEDAYMKLLQEGASPQEARAVLPNSLKTEIVVTGNVREWRHFFKLRVAKEAHPQMRELAMPLLNEMKQILPEIFDDIEVNE